MARMGKPPSHVDWELFEKIVWVPISVINTTQLSDMLKVSKKTLERKVKEKYGLTIDAVRMQKQGPMRHSLFEALWNQVKNGNVTAIIWATKNIFGWSDKVDQSAQVEQALEVTYKAEWGSQVETTPTSTEPD